MKKDDMKKAIGRRIRQARINSDLSQPELARAMNKSKQLIHAWEYGKAEIKSTSLAQRAVVLNVSADWLLFGALK